MDANNLILYILLGAVFGIIYSLRRMYVLERKIGALEKLIAGKVIRSRKRK